MNRELLDNIIKWFVYGSMIGSMITWFIVMHIAKSQDWVIFLDFNVIGEGWFEYIYIIIWGILAIYVAYLKIKELI